MITETIRVAVVDDHQAVRVGLRALLQSEPGILPVGEADCAEATWPLLYRTAPDVVLLDYQLPDSDGLSICRRIKSDAPAPAVLLYSAFADAALIVPGIVAGADGIVHKGSTARELFEAIRLAADGANALPPLSTTQLEAAALALDPQDLPILGMLVDRTPPRDIAACLRYSPDQLNHRIASMLSALSLRTRTAAAPPQRAAKAPAG